MIKTVETKLTGIVAEEQKRFFAIKLLEAEQVVIVPGSAFGEFGEGYIRLSYAASMEDLRQGLDKIEAFVRSLR